MKKHVKMMKTTIDLPSEVIIAFNMFEAKLIIFNSDFTTLKGLTEYLISMRVIDNKSQFEKNYCFVCSDKPIRDSLFTVMKPFRQTVTDQETLRSYCLMMADVADRRQGILRNVAAGKIFIGSPERFCNRELLDFLEKDKTYVKSTVYAKRDC